MISLPSPQTLQLVYIDAFFLCLTIGLLLWFRSWLTSHKGQIDRRLAALEEHELTLERLAAKLTAACRQLEASRPTAAMANAPGIPMPAARPVAARSGAEVTAPGAAWLEKLSELRRAADGGSSESAPVAGRQGARQEYVRARQLLEKGMSATDVARKVGLGLAEVEVLKRISEYGDYST